MVLPQQKQPTTEAKDRGDRYGTGYRVQGVIKTVDVGWECGVRLRGGKGGGQCRGPQVITRHGRNACPAALLGEGTGAQPQA